MIYTVGYEVGYDEQLAGPNARKFNKVGRNGSYPGGFAVRTPLEAARLIQEWDKKGEWATYEVDADWEADTKPSLQGWWHALQRDARILRKVETPELLPFHPPHWTVEAEAVMNVRIIAPMEEHEAVLNWFYDRGGRTLRSGPLMKDFPRADMSQLDFSGWIPLTGSALHPEPFNADTA